MTTAKRIGICMDHSGAQLMEFMNGVIQTKTITSKFTHSEKEHSLSKSESLMHHKEQHQQAEYYKELGEAIRNYQEVLLFGPTEAKTELYNILRADHRFGGIKIEIRQTDRMTENQEHAFVKAHFSVKII